jgi:hypothetical protein
MPSPLTRLPLILFTDTFFAPLDGDLVVAGKDFHPLLVVIGTLSDHFLAQDGNADDLAKEMNHLLGSDNPLK